MAGRKSWDPRSSVWDVRFMNEQGEQDGYFFEATEPEAQAILAFLKEAEKQNPGWIHNLEMIHVSEAAWPLKDVWAAVRERYEEEDGG